MELSPEERAELAHEVPFTREFDSFARTLPRSRALPRLVARRDNRRRLLEQVEFLTRYGSLAQNVAIVGFPGTHFSTLVDLFPTHTFSVCASDVHALARDSLLIFSLCGEHLEDGLALQREIVARIQPKMALLRFQPPRAGSEFEYLAGSLFWPVWGGADCCDCLLATDGSALISYNVSRYYDAMHRFNLCTRQQAYRVTPFKSVYGMDYCYDCAAEVDIWKRYLKSFGKASDSTEIATLMNRASIVCSERLLCGGHGRLRTREPTLNRLEKL